MILWFLYNTVKLYYHNVIQLQTFNALWIMSENPAIFYSAVIFKVVWRGNLKSLIVKMDIVSGGYTGHCYFVVAQQRNI